MPEEGPNTITIILAGDFNIELKKKENETFLMNMEETFGLKSCIDMVFARNVDNLKCASYITYFSYHRPILSITNST
jgi:endonuclease/exonuclease/phosphatase (EEP) superfamily protein YafD